VYPSASIGRDAHPRLAQTERIDQQRGRTQLNRSDRR
jgi:hypothetical protein